MSEKFTIEQATPPPVAGRGNPKSELSLKIESLKPGEVLRFRPQDDTVTATNVRSTVARIRRTTKRTLMLRKVDGGFDIYRTA